MRRCECSLCLFELSQCNNCIGAIDNVDVAQLLHINNTG